MEKKKVWYISGGSWSTWPRDPRGRTANQVDSCQRALRLVLKLLGCGYPLLVLNSLLESLWFWHLKSLQKFEFLVLDSSKPLGQFKDEKRTPKMQKYQKKKKTKKCIIQSVLWQWWPDSFVSVDKVLRFYLLHLQVSLVTRKLTSWQLLAPISSFVPDKSSQSQQLTAANSSAVLPASYSKRLTASVRTARLESTADPKLYK